MNDATSTTEITREERNAHYGKLNARFDVREKFLIAAGFKRETLPGLNLAVYTKTRFGRIYAIPACKLSLADEIVWEDTADEIKRFNA